MEQPTKHSNLYLTCRDHFLTGESFELVYNESKDLLITTPRPSSPELSRYYESLDYQSHSTRIKSFFDLVYFLIRKISTRRKLKLIRKFRTQQNNLLDVGAGIGYFLNSASNSGWNSIGVELSDTARSIANNARSNSVKEMNHLDSLQQNTFDVVTLWHVLEHMGDLDYEIKRIKGLLGPNGRIVVAVPNFKSYDADYFKEYWAGYDVPRHLWHFSRSSISKLFKKHGLKIESIHPMIFDSFYISLMSTKYKFGKISYIKGILIGLVSNIKAIFSKEYSSLIYVIKRQ